MITTWTKKCTDTKNGEKKKNLLVLIDPVKANHLVEQYN